MISWPEMAEFEVPESAPAVRSISSTIDHAFNERPILERVTPGMRVGLAVGSRGIDGIDDIVEHIANLIRLAGATPILIPAMGSHGAATAAGQAKVLRRLLPKTSSSVEIDARTQTCTVADQITGFQVAASLAAFEVDGLVTVSRVRPHTMFDGEIESGLCKMLTVGLGKFDGASEFHARVSNEPYESLLAQGASVLSSHYTLLGGVAVIENNFGRLAALEAVSPDAFAEADRRLLKVARGLMPRLPLYDWDLLIVEELGKDISGTGMDTNVIGRKTKDKKSMGKIVVLGLSERSDGNAYGLGYADATTAEVVQSIDPTSADANTAASGNKQAGQIPVSFASERQAIASLISDRGEAVKVIHIRNTKDIRRICLSKASTARVRHLRQTTEWRAMNFSPSGRLRRLSQ